MAKTKISEWDSNPNNNTDIDSINIAEGCAPSGINNAIRELMSQVKDLYAGTSGDTLAVAGGGTGAGTAAGARTNLGLGSMATQADTSVDINGGNIDGTAIGASSASTGAFTTLAASGAVTLSGATANGVMYANGSKVLTTGSALTFNGADMAIGGTNTNSARLALVDNSSNNYSSALDFRQTYASTVYSRVYANFGGTLALSADVGNAASGTSDIEFYLSGSEKMRLTSTGLGIGTSAPNQAGLDKAVSVNGTNHSIIEANVAGGRAGYMYAASQGTVIGEYRVKTLQFTTSDTVRATLDSSGNLGLGVTPSAWWSNDRAYQVLGGSLWAYTGGNDNVNISANHYQNSSNNPTYIGSGYATRYAQSSGQHQWYTAPSGTAGNAISFTQAMTLDSSGNLLVGTTSVIGNGKICVLGNAGATAIGVQVGANGNYGIQFQNASNVNAGFIQVNASTTLYSTSSDYRLKENIQPMTGALAKVAALKPCTYTWKSDGSDGEGFIAHELQAVVPQCVTGEKDAVDADGNPVYQGIDTSFLVATLTAALQEAHGLIKDLQSRVDALEAK